MKTKAITLACFNEHNRRDELMTFYIQLALIIILYMLLMISFIMLIGLKDIAFFIGIPSIIFIVLLLLWNKRRHVIYLSLFIGLSFIGLFFLYPYIINGCLLIINEVIDLIGIHTGIMILPFDLNVAEHMQHTALHITLTYIGLLMAYMSYNIVVYKRAFLLWSVVIVLFVLQWIVQREMFTFINLSLLFMSLGINRKTKHDQQYVTGSIVAPLSAYGILLAIAVILSVSITHMQPKDGYEKLEMIEALQRKGKQFMHDVRFESNKTNTFTNGDFQALGPLVLKDEVALEVTMDQPTPLYLRGFTGSAYAHDEWQTLDGKVTHAHRDLLYWLNEEAFHPLNQLSNINELVGEKDLMDQTTMMIRNVNANRRYIYTPYELASKPNEIVKTNLFNDQMIESRKWFGDRTYTFETYTNLTSNYPTLANKLYSLIEAKEIDDYMQLENHYNAFVQKVYTNIPDDIRAILDHHVTLDLSDEQDTPYEEAIHYIRHYLHQHMTYTTRPETLPEGKDFLLHFLEDTKEGYATHFATAATLMFRYLDIPARYVEGYLLTPQDIEDAQPGEKIYIKGANAHAWSEIYIDQIGWIPVEMTPPYFDKMPPVDTSNYPEGTDNFEKEKSELVEQDASGTRKVKEDDKREVIEEREDQRDTTEKSFDIWLLILIILIVIVITVYLLYLLQKKIALVRLKKSFNDPNLNKAIHHMFLYTMTLIHYDGIKERGGSIYRYISDIEEKYGSAFASQFQQVINIHQKAQFSQDELEQTYYDRVNHFIDEVIKYTYRSKGWLKRLKMKWIDVIV